MDEIEKYRNSLTAGTRESLDLPNEERIKKVEQQVWIPYAQASQIIEELDHLINFPKRDRMPNLLIVGNTNNGKTTILNRFKSMYPNEAGVRGNIIPIIHFQAPIAPSHSALYEKILDFLKVPYGASDSASKKEYQVSNILKDIETRMLIIDEFQDIFHGDARQQKKFLAAVKHLANQLQIPIVAAGVGEVQRVLAADPQMANRFEPMRLEKWKLNEDFARLVMSLEKTLPLRKPSYLHSRETLMKLYELSGGILGELITVIQRAAVKAIQEGTEQIDMKTLKSIRFVKPSERRK